jgi:hypothetical protein
MIKVVSTSQVPSAHSTCGIWTMPVKRAARRMFDSVNGSSRYAIPLARRYASSLPV